MARLKPRLRRCGLASQGQWPCSAARTCMAINDDGFAVRVDTTLTIFGQTAASTVLFTQRLDGGDVRMAVGLKAWALTVAGFVGVKWGKLEGIRGRGLSASPTG